MKIVIGLTLNLPSLSLFSFCKCFSLFLRTNSALFTIVVMKAGFTICSILLVLFIAACGGPSHQIVGTWRAGDEANAMIWEFSGDGSLLLGTNRGRYSFGDNNRIKIETSIATSVYQMQLAGDKMTLTDPRGSKLVLTKVK